MSSLPPQLAEAAPPKTATRSGAGPLYHAFKRIFDLILSGVLLVLLLPVWLLLAVLIKLDSKGSVLFAQSVVGKNGAEFVLYKFRSMLPNSQRQDHVSDVERNFRSKLPTATDDKGAIFKTALADQRRITRVGRFLRRTSVDELPQVWNVFRGEMSFVGPRPALPYEARLYEDWQKRRFLVRPGLTGLYQVTARNRVPIEEMISIDLEYVGNESFLLDLKILLKTPVAMFSGL